MTFAFMLRDQRRRHAARASRLARAMDVPDDQHFNKRHPGTPLDAH